MRTLVVQAHSSQKPILHQVKRHIEGLASALATLVPIQAALATDMLQANAPHADFAHSKKRAGRIGPQHVMAGADLLACQVGSH